MVRLQPSVKGHTTFTDFFFVLMKNEAKEVPLAFIEVKNTSIAVDMVWSRLQHNTSAVVRSRPQHNTSAVVRSRPQHNTSAVVWSRPQNNSLRTGFTYDTKRPTAFPPITLKPNPSDELVIVTVWGFPLDFMLGRFEVEK